MKRTILVLAIVIFTSGFISAQSFEKGNHAINAGIGFGNTIYSGTYYGFYIPAFSVSYEYAIVEVSMGSSLTGVVTAGGYFGITGSKYDPPGDYLYKNTYIMFAARGNYHFIFHDQFDPYAGIQFGGYFVSSKYSGPSGSSIYSNPASGSAFVGVYAGARWFFNDFIAVYTELGYNLTVFAVGVTFKF